MRLAISKEIITHHGGKFWAESVAGKGSDIHFILPIVERRSSQGEVTEKKIDRV